jgi:hypothetical protein
MRSRLPARFPLRDNLFEGQSIDKQKTWTLPILSTSADPKRLRRVSGEERQHLLPIQRSFERFHLPALVVIATPLILFCLTPFLFAGEAPMRIGILMIGEVALALLTGGIQLILGPIFLQTLLHRNAASLDVFSSLMHRLSGLSLLSTVLVCIVAPQITLSLFHTALFGNIVSIVAIVLFLHNLTVAVFAWLGAKEHIFLFSLLALISIFFGINVAIVLVGFYKIGMVGALFAIGASYALIAFTGLPFLFYRLYTS